MRSHLVLLSLAVFLLTLACEKTSSTTFGDAEKTIEVSSISLNKTAIEMFEGDTETLTATVLPSNATDKTIVWSSLGSCVTVDQNGVITAKKKGESRIQAKAGDKSALCDVVVKKRVPIRELRIMLARALWLEVFSHEPLYTAINHSSIQLYAYYNRDASDTTVTWTSNNPSVADIDRNGVVSAHNVGTVKITLSVGGKSASCTIITYELPNNAIDMGRSVIWYDKNLGANRPEELGDRYAWGETETKTTFNDRNYTPPAGWEGQRTYGDLPIEYDVANKKLRGKWRIGDIHMLDNNYIIYKAKDVNGIQCIEYYSYITGNSVLIPSPSEAEAIYAYWTIHTGNSRGAKYGDYEAIGYSIHKATSFEGVQTYFYIDPIYSYGWRGFYIRPAIDLNE